MSRSVPVALPLARADRSYEVVIGSGLLAEAGERLRPFLRRPRAAVVTDETVHRLHGERLAGGLEMAGIETRSVVIAPGEETKSFAGLADLADRMLALELDRNDLVVAFGGGVVGDLAGFAAAIFKRGVDFVQIPTTLLAQVDSSVGGKTAIDTARGKNLIGAFHQPRLVLADLSLLATLPRRQVACGYAEILKCALLGDAEFFAWLESHGAAVLSLDEEPLSHAVATAVAMKARIVANDEREAGERALLNLGHTFAHALEVETGYGQGLEHGEAVGLGCALAFRFSATLGLCPEDDAHRVAAAVTAAGLPSRLADIAGHRCRAGALVGRMTQDKKASAGALNLVLVRRIGEAFLAKDVERTAIEAFLLAEGAGR
ncbi:MAG: 3-dehydroquinate synthase [Caulobacteraceae bacterium]